MSGKFFKSEIAEIVYGFIIALCPLTGYLIGSNFADTMEMGSWQWRSWTRIILGGIFPLVGTLWISISKFLEKDYENLEKIWLLSIALMASIYPAFFNLQGPVDRKLKIEKLECLDKKLTLDNCLHLKEAFLEGGHKVKFDAKSDISKRIQTGKFFQVKTIDKKIIWIDKTISE